MSDRCTGKCCQAFVLGGYTKEQIQYFYDNDEIEKEDRPPLPEGLNYFRRIDGIKEWWPWMKYIGSFEEHPITKEKNASDKKLEFFNCTKLQPNGDCGVYDKRPHFCQSYGVDIDCEHKDCNWKSGREAREKLKAEKEKAEKEFLVEYEKRKADGYYDEVLEKEGIPEVADATN